MQILLGIYPVKLSINRSHNYLFEHKTIQSENRINN
jgi:hypothetical protein